MSLGKFPHDRVDHRVVDQGRRRFLFSLGAAAGGLAFGSTTSGMARAEDIAAASLGDPRPAPRIARRKKRTANIGVFGVGHYTYWK